MIKSYFSLAIGLLFISSTSFSNNCFYETGTGTFEGNDPFSDWAIRTEDGSGSLELESSIAYAGNNSVKAVVAPGAVAWHVRME